MDIEEVFTFLGSFGRYQRFIFVLMCLVMIPCAFVKQANTFLGATTDHYCQVAGNQTYEAYSPLKLCTIPISDSSAGEEDNTTGSVYWEMCTQYDVNVYNFTNTSEIPQELCDSQRDIVSCQTWVYDRSTYDNTVVHEFDLVCGREWLNYLAKLMVPAGNLVGAVVLGQLADIFGRKHVFFTCIILTFLAGFVTTFATNIVFYMVGQFCMGFFHSGVYIVAIVIGMEIVTENHRAMGVTLIMCFYAFGYMLVAVLALLLKSNWQRLLFTISISWLVYFPYYWIVPESLRWLINRRRFMKAHALVDRIAEHNKVELPINFYKKCFPSYMDESHQKRTIVDLFKSRRLALRMCIACIIWFSISCTYFGIYLEADKLSMSPYLRPVVTTIVEIPSFLLTWLLVTIIGRRTMLMFNTAFAGLALVAAIFVGHFVVMMMFLFIGKIFIACSLAVAHLITLEFLPTPVRSVGFGLAFAFSCLGTIVCPFVLMLGDYWKPFPFLIFSILTLASAGLALLLPKTVRKKLPETMEDGEALKRRGSRMYEADDNGENVGSEIKLQLEREDGTGDDNL